MLDNRTCRQDIDGKPTGLYVEGWREVWRANLKGHATRVWERVMPRLTDDIRDCSIYLYRDDVDAHCGVNAGGSGFLYEIPLDESDDGGEGTPICR